MELECLLGVPRAEFGRLEINLLSEFLETLLFDSITEYYFFLPKSIGILGTGAGGFGGFVGTLTGAVTGAFNGLEAGAKD